MAEKKSDLEKQVAELTKQVALLLKANAGKILDPKELVGYFWNEKREKFGRRRDGTITEVLKVGKPQRDATAQFNIKKIVQKAKDRAASEKE